MTTPEKQPNTKPLNAWALAMELGFIIVLPLVVLVLAGVALDRRFATTPLFIIIGMAGAFCLSAAIVYRKIRRLQL